MQGDPRYFMGGSSSSYDYEQQQGYFHGNGDIGGYYPNDGFPPPPPPPPRYYDNNMTGINNQCPGGGLYNGIQFQASENCPENYVIFDQTNNTSRIMLNPSYAQKLGCPGFNLPTCQAQGSKDIHERDDRYISSSSFKEDSEDIDALLSLDKDDDNDDDDDDDDVVSTGRTRGRYNCDSPDSTTSTAASRYGKQRCSSTVQYAGNAGRSGERKREKVKKMVKVLRGIVPGGQKMDTPAFLDEAVKYLKSLKMEVKKLGIQSTND